MLPMTLFGFFSVACKKLYSTIALRKIYNTIGFLIPALGFFSIFFTQGIFSKEVQLWIVSLSLTFHQLAMSGGFFHSHADIFGPFATLAFSTTLTFAQIPGVLLPPVNDLMIPHHVPKEAHNVFYLAGGICLIGMFVYLFGGTAQPLDLELNEDKEDEESRETSLEGSRDSPNKSKKRDVEGENPLVAFIRASGDTDLNLNIAV